MCEFDPNRDPRLLAAIPTDLLAATTIERVMAALAERPEQEGPALAGRGKLLYQLRQHTPGPAPAELVQCPSCGLHYTNGYDERPIAGSACFICQGSGLRALLVEFAVGKLLADCMSEGTTAPLRRLLPRLHDDSPWSVLYTKAIEGELTNAG